MAAAIEARPDLEVLRDARDHVPSRSQLQWGFPPVRRQPTVADRMRTWGPVGVVVVASHWT